MVKRPKERVVVALSGGVDSAYAAYLLKRQGYECIGATLKTWPKDECVSGEGKKPCCSLESITRARAVALKLGIPYYVFDVYERFKREVIDYFASEYRSGRTPNPCIPCNEKLKFGYLLDRAESLGARAVATGHFARLGLSSVSGRTLLRKGVDCSKDQSYFLFSLSQEQLKRAVFPLGAMKKEKVRAAARRAGLPCHDAVSSQDICFAQREGYVTYLSEKYGMTPVAGEIVDDSGRVLGSHKGILSYTIGQRRGLGVAFKEPLYVTGFDLPKNRVIVGTKRSVLKKRVVAERVNWIAIDAPSSKPMRIKAKIRYNHVAAAATITRHGKEEVIVDFEKAQEAPTPGQAIVFYERDIVVGGGWIQKAMA